MELTVVFILVLLVGAALLVRYLRAPMPPPATPSAASEPPLAEAKAQSAQPPPPPPPLWEAINPLLPQIGEAYAAAVHPSALLADVAFAQAVQLLSDPRYGFADVLACAQSNVPAAASCGLEALRRRADSEDASDALLERFDGANSWIGYFILKYVDDRNAPRATERFLSKAQTWWPSNAVALQSLQEHVELRLARETRFAWERELDALTEEDLAAIEAVIRALGIPGLKPLLDGIGSERERKVDTEFLSSFGQLISAPQTSGIARHGALDTALAQAERAIVQALPKSIAIVGEAGVGKSCLAELVIAEYVARGWTVFQAEASDLLSGQKYMGELEERVGQLFRNLDPKKRVVWYVPSLEEFGTAGRHRYSARSLIDMMIPQMTAGKLVVIAKCQPKGFKKLAQARPRLNACFDRIELAPLGDAAAIQLARDWLQLGVSVSDSLLAEAHQLATQYFGELSSPGNLIELLKLSISRIESPDTGPLELTLDDLVLTLCQQTGLPQALLDDRAKLDLESLRNVFRERVMGQPEAVDCLVDRVAMIKAGLTDPSRPLGVFLFVGPSGTGKTEIAKALTTFLLGSEDRMIRLDMSEFQSGAATQKLLGGYDENDQSESLASRIRKQPFSVLLLDEFEKADSGVWDLFLQVFDDGRLTDNQGYTVDCRHCLIIMTSNLGAARELAPVAGFGSEQRGFDSSGLTAAINRTFRPEFVNRIDRIVVFQPLSRSVMRGILQHELNRVLRRRGLRSRQWAVEWAHSAIEFLLEKGFTHDLGARPLKRAIDRYLLSPLAQAIVNREVPEGDQFLLVKAGDGQLVVEFVDPDAPPPLPSPNLAAAAPADGASTVPMEAIVAHPIGDAVQLAAIAATIVALRQEIESGAWQTIKAAAYDATSHSGFWSDPGRFRALGRIETIDRVESALKRSESLCERLTGSKGKSAGPDLALRLAQQAMLLRHAIADTIADRPQEAFLRVSNAGDSQAAEDDSRAVRCFERLAGMYRRWAEKRRMKWTELDFQPPSGSQRAAPQLLLFVSGFGACSLLEPEAGLHVWEQDGERAGKRLRFRVEVAAAPTAPLNRPDEYRTAAAAAFGEDGAVSTGIVRRYADGPSPLVRDTVSNTRTGRLEQVLDGDFDVVAFL